MKSDAGGHRRPTYGVRMGAFFRAVFARARTGFAGLSSPESGLLATGAFLRAAFRARAGFSVAAGDSKSGSGVATAADG